MIGGEFDLSAGVASITSGLTAAMICYQLGLNMWVGALVSLLFALFIGFVNGYLVVRTGIPSFLITLGTFFVLQGANLGVTKLITGSVGHPERRRHRRFRRRSRRSSPPPSRSAASRVKITVIWWFLFVAIAHLDPDPHPDRQLDLRRRRQRRPAPARSVCR